MVSIFIILGISVHTCEHVQYLPSVQIGMTNSWLKFSTEELTNTHQGNTLSWAGRPFINDDSVSHLELEVPFTEEMGCSFENVLQRERDGEGEKKAVTRTPPSAYRGDVISRALSSSKNSLASAAPAWGDGENLSTTSLDLALDLRTFEVGFQGFCYLVLMIYSCWAESRFLESHF